jgi:hypothetical protein
MNASVNASLPSCIDVFSAHGLIAVLHLSKEKKAPLLVELKKGFARKAIQATIIRLRKKSF